MIRPKSLDAACLILLAILLLPLSAFAEDPQAAFDPLPTRPSTFTDLSAQATDQQRVEQAYQYLLGGQGQPVDQDLAISLLTRAASAGNVQAQTLLGMAYRYGRFAKASNAQAREWLEKAARAGDPTAQYHLGLILAENATDTQQLMLSYIWWTEAAKQGNRLAGKALKELDYRLSDEDKAQAESLRSEVYQGPVAPPKTTNLGPDTPLRDLAEGSIELQQVTAQWIRNREAGNLFVIQGYALNQYNQPRTAIVVYAILTGRQGQSLSEVTAYAGNPIPPNQLRDMSYDRVLQRMLNPKGEGGVRPILKPGDSLPFTVVFRDVPPNVVQYVIKAQSASAEN